MILQPLPPPCSLDGNEFHLLCTSTSLMVSVPATLWFCEMPLRQMTCLDPISGVQRTCNTNLQLLEMKTTLGRFSSKHSQVLDRQASVSERLNHCFPFLTALLWWIEPHKHYRYSWLWGTALHPPTGAVTPQNLLCLVWHQDPKDM